MGIFLSIWISPKKGSWTPKPLPVVQVTPQSPVEHAAELLRCQLQCCRWGSWPSLWPTTTSNASVTHMQRPPRPEPMERRPKEPTDRSAPGGDLEDLAPARRGALM